LGRRTDGRQGRGEGGSGAFSLPVTFPNRIGEPAGKTSPEELMAAAPRRVLRDGHECPRWEKKGGKAAKTHVTATVSADKGDSGIKIVSSKLKVIVEGSKA
jgi:organic hydroperoxide reductase OsmC/OhrA